MTRKRENSTIFKLAIEHYHALGHSQAEDTLLKEAQGKLSNVVTQVILERRGKKVRRFTDGEAAEVLHALGMFMNQNGL